MMATKRITDPYATLGVARGATSSQVRAAYRRLAKRHHPDLHGDARSTERMRRINEAREILSSPSRRAEYDAGAGAHVGATRGHWAAAPRWTPPAAHATPSWTAAYGARPVHAGARPYASQRPADGSSGPLPWLGLFLLLPLVVLSVSILSVGIVPFPLLGFLVLVIVGRLVSRDDC